jgi:AcrR family transcriptional regulator
MAPASRRRAGHDEGAGTGPGQPPTPGRRERKKQETLRRIFDAADELFARKGYAAVTTQEVAEAADVGAGTLFRYARNKAELLIMVMNERLRLGAESGLVIAERGSSPVDSIFGLIEPLVQAFLSQPENTAGYQREVLFGADGPYRAEALDRIRQLEDAMAMILTRYAATGATRHGVDVRRVASTIFSVLYLKLVRLELGQVSPRTLPDELRSDIDYLVRELLDAPA